MIKKLFFVFSLFLFFQCTINEKNGFENISSNHSNILFNNILIENDSINILDNEFFYNGAGLALGDFNNDSLVDVFFAGNQVDNKLYLNKGNLVFDDVTDISNLNKSDNLIWSSGVNVLDINNDNLQDIYVCNTLRKDSNLRKNMLYINLGINENGIPVFENQAEKYGLDDSTYSSHAQFFDYDNDGDLDLFIGVNRIEGIDPNVFRNIHDDNKVLSIDKLYENIETDSLEHPYFIDVSKEAKIKFHGYSHSTIINDFNQDGYADIYVANDYLSSDLVYINNKNKTFTNRAGEMFKHFSLSSMGSDISDINNDGKLDLFVSEMQPYYNKRKKLFQKGTNYQREILTKRYNYEYQYTRNTLQLNNGINKKTGLPIFSEIGMFSEVHETDWSWASLFADFDNDGLKDLFIANGFPKDVIDKDFSDFRQTASRLVSKEKLLAAIPQIKIQNFIFKNRDGIRFDDYTNNWGLDFATYSNGAVYGDLDNDGDLDIVLNNINDKATLLENKINNSNNFFRVKLEGTLNNKSAYGSVVSIFSNNIEQKHTLISGRGYLSKTEDELHFGIGNSSKVDSVIVTWPGGYKQIFKKDLIVNNTNILKYDTALLKKKIIADSTLTHLKEYNNESKIIYKDNDIDFIDFNFQRTLPRKFSQFGPSLAVGDLDGNGKEDILVGGSREMNENIFFQNTDGTYKRTQLNLKTDPNKFQEDAGICIFDIENDGDLDIYISHGSSQYSVDSDLYQDLIWINDGFGNFKILENGFPEIKSNGSAVKSCDFDLDGDLDLIIGSRVKPMSYPLSDKTFLLKNISNSKKTKLIDVTSEVFPNIDFGMVSDFIWSDFNNDNWPDLLVASEWSPIRFFKNNYGVFTEVKNSGIENHSGWWNSLLALDVDNDGDTDYVSGNFGENTYLKANMEMPISILAKDFDSNGSIDPFISYFLRDSVGVKKKFIYHPMEDVIKQYTEIRKKYNSFGEFGDDTMDEIFDEKISSDAIKKSSSWMKTSWIENLGNEKFKIHALPDKTQFAPIYSILSFNYDEDEYEDLMLVGNDFGIETKQGRADALNGIILRNLNGKGFEVIDFEKTNFFVPGDAKSLIKTVNSNNEILYLVSQNKDSLKVFKTSNLIQNKIFDWKKNEFKCKIAFDSNNFKIIERTSFNSFQSQSSNKIVVNSQARELIFYNNQGDIVRKINLN